METHRDPVVEEVTQGDNAQHHSPMPPHAPASVDTPHQHTDSARGYDADEEDTDHTSEAGHDIQAMTQERLAADLLQQQEATSRAIRQQIRRTDHDFEDFFEDFEDAAAFVPSEGADADDEEDEESHSAETTTSKSKKRSKTQAKPPRKKTKHKAAKKASDSSSNSTPRPQLSNNVQQDYATTAHLPAPPEAQAARTRRDALQSVIRSIPAAEHRGVKPDLALLRTAMRDIDGLKSIKASQTSAEGWLLNGMKSRLKHYQVMALAFMRRRENDLQEPRGGILADSMGLGKTVMVLSNIINGLYARKKFNFAQRRVEGFEEKPRPTLIVVPSSLLMQWKDEVAKHCHYNPVQRERGKKLKRTTVLSAEAKAGIFNMMEYKDLAAEVGPKETKQRKHLEKQDIVFITYRSLLSTFPKLSPPASLITTSDKAAWYREALTEFGGLLYNFKWQRVVLDEAHYIKNHLSLTSKACRALQACHHWAVTGTPVQNSILEFYPYMRFIREPSIESMRQFKANFEPEEAPEDEDAQARLDREDNNELALKRLVAILGKVMLRRTHADSMFGAKLLDVPEVEKPLTIYLNLNATERRVYDIVQSNFIKQMHGMLEQSNQDSYKHLWNMVLRLRQATGHILLMHDVLVDLIELTDFQQLITEMPSDRENEDGLEVMAQLSWTLRHLSINEDTSADSLHHKVSQTTMDLLELRDLMPNFDHEIGGMYGTRGLHLRRYLEELGKGERFEKISKKAECAECKSPPVQPYITSCQHIYCQECLISIQQQAARRGRGQAPCSYCGDFFTSSERCHEAIESSHEDLEYRQRAQHAKGKKQKEGRRKINRWLEMGGPLAPSTKTMAVKAQILRWQAMDPAVKIIIFSQFLEMLDIFARICRMESWTYRRYQGTEMSLKARDKAIKEFNDPGQGIQILLCSLKSGGLGLNLTAASRVIIVDSWWNDSVEQQAFCRVFRHGQTKQTSLTRLVVRDTVDEALMDMKERKLLEIDPVMGTRDSSHKPTMTELLRLFGLGDVGEHERDYIVAQTSGGEYNDDIQRFVDSDDKQEFYEMDFEP